MVYESHHRKGAEISVAENLTLSNIVKRFGRMTAVDRLHLDVEEGEFLTLLGPSGCGKSTTLRLIAGLERPDEGTISLGGRVMAPVRTACSHRLRSAEWAWSSRVTPCGRT